MQEIFLDTCTNCAKKYVWLWDWKSIYTEEEEERYKKISSKKCRKCGGVLKRREVFGKEADDLLFEADLDV